MENIDTKIVSIIDSIDSIDAIKQLKALYLENNRRRFPSLPDAARVVPAYTDKNTKGLTKCITDYVRLKGYHLERTGCEGRILDQRQTFTDCIGKTRTIGTIKRIKTSSQRGTSDLKAIINGKFIAIEIKCKATNDRQSQVQKEYQQQVENSGGVYLIASSFNQFYTWFNNYTRERAKSQQNER
jgi:hypothetical protein